MNCNQFVSTTLGDIAQITMGQSPKGSSLNKIGEGIPFIQGNRTFGFLYPTIDTYTSSPVKNANKGDILFSVRAPVGDINIAQNDLCIGRGICAIKSKTGENGFLFYLLKNNIKRLVSQANGTVFTSVNRNDLESFEVVIPSSPDYRTRISDILSTIDRKIELNNQLNDYLIESIICLYENIKQSEELIRYRADDLFDIHIGKTPPRKEPIWFTNDGEENYIWVSIKDMASNGPYLFKSSEYLKPNAIKKFNINRCPIGSILLSFKLTVGRVGIAAKELVTNEAIACLNSKDPEKLAYLYPLLKTYDYASLGSTSSIATAVNSKTIKGMQIEMPNSEVLCRYHKETEPLYNLLLNNTQEIERLVNLRDILLEKLINGKIHIPVDNFNS